jgi:hypothetical protein
MTTPAFHASTVWSPFWGWTYLGERALSSVNHWTESFNPTEENRKKVLRNIGKVVIGSLDDSGILATQ